jgi:hypothetical protein
VILMVAGAVGLALSFVWLNAASRRRGPVAVDERGPYVR